MATKRQRMVQQALDLYAPLAPLEDTLEIKTLCARQHMRELTVDTAVWLSIVTHIRHNHTDYHALLADGYDRESARHFVLDAMNEVLSRWGSRRMITSDQDGE